jgi:hypothetical protein
MINVNLSRTHFLRPALLSAAVDLWGELYPALAAETRLRPYAGLPPQTFSFIIYGRACRCFLPAYNIIVKKIQQPDPELIFKTTQRCRLF